MSLGTHNIMNNAICTLFDNILIDIYKFKSFHCFQDNDAKEHPFFIVSKYIFMLKNMFCMDKCLFNN